MTSENRAVRACWDRLSERGLVRFEVLAPVADRTLIRSLARKLSEDSADAARLRAAVTRSVMGVPPKTGGVLAALRRSPLLGADLDLEWPRAPRRDGQGALWT